MTIRRLVLAGTALAAVVGLGACRADEPSAEPAIAPSTAPSATATSAPPAPSGARADLVAAAGMLAATTARLRMTGAGGYTVTGPVDVANHRAELTMRMGSVGEMVIRQVGTDLYVKAAGSPGAPVGSAEGRWMHLDQAAVAAESPLNVGNNDPRSVASLVAASSRVQKKGAHGFTGVLDLTKAQTAGTAVLQALGSRASAVPFTAETDARGRLTRLTVDLNAISAGAGTMAFAYSDLGAPVAVQAPPAAQVVEMPAAFREAVGA